METRTCIPRKIIHEILTRVPVKSLLRFKCVAKSWRSLISDETFVKAHLSKSSRDAAMIRVRHDRAPPLWSPPLLSVERLDDDNGSSPVVRSCRGLVCCFSVSGTDFILWNPSTRKYRNLPPVDFDRGIDDVSTTSCGFGYVESDNDYKVLALSLRRETGEGFRCVAKVYSLKMDRWRTVDDNYQLKTTMDSTARYLGGILYWLRPFVTKEDRLRWEIVSFDLEKEAFGIAVEQPGEDLVDGFCTARLGVLHDSLCMLCSGVTGEMVILQLKQQAWTRMATVPLPCLRRRPRLPTDLVGVGPDGSILRAHELNLRLCYRPNPTLIRRLWIDELDILNRACAHVESLVSLGSSEEDAGTCDIEMVYRA